MKCDICHKKLKVQQTIVNYNQNTVTRRRFCPGCRIVYLSEERIIDKYPIEKEQSNLDMFEKVGD